MRVFELTLGIEMIIGSRVALLDTYKHPHLSTYLLTSYNSSTIKPKIQKRYKFSTYNSTNTATFLSNHIFHSYFSRKLPKKPKSNKCI